MGRLVFKLFTVMAFVTWTAFRYLAFSPSTCFFNASVLACFTDTGCLGLKSESVFAARELPSSFISISASECNSFCNLLSSLSDFFCSLYSSTCCRSTEWMADKSPLMASEATYNGASKIYVIVIIIFSFHDMCKTQTT
jgi:hypothetical protein